MADHFSGRFHRAKAGGWGTASASCNVSSHTLDRISQICPTSLPPSGCFSCNDLHGFRMGLSNLDEQSDTEKVKLRQDEMSFDMSTGGYTRR